VHVWWDVNKIALNWRQVNAPCINVAPPVNVLKFFFQNHSSSIYRNIEFNLFRSLQSWTGCAVDVSLVVEGNLTHFAVNDDGWNSVQTGSCQCEIFSSSHVSSLRWNCVYDWSFQFWIPERCC
jgi:hypothetical protein